MHDADAYTSALLALSPRGEAWPRDRRSIFARVLQAAADGLARIDRRVDDLRLEQQPLTTFELLPEWEVLVGEPDSCAGAATTLSERRQRVQARLTMRGGQSAVYFVELAASLGFTATVEQYRPAWAGFVAAGEPLWSEAAAFYWTLVVLDDGSATQYLSVGDGAGEPLAAWGDQALECTASRYQPAEGDVAFAYRTRAETLAGIAADFVAGAEICAWPRLGRRPREAWRAGVFGDFAAGREWFWRAGL